MTERERDGVFREVNSGGVLPESQRGEDMGRQDALHDLANQPARPLTGDEKKAAEHSPDKPPHREQLPATR